MTLLASRLCCGLDQSERVSFGEGGAFIGPRSSGAGKISCVIVVAEGEDDGNSSVDTFPDTKIILLLFLRS